MSSRSEINFNVWIERLVEIFENSKYLFPRTIGDNTNTEDLVKQIIPYDLPIAQDVQEGEGPPHIFVREAPNPIMRDTTSGRSSKGVKGPRELQLEFWAVLVVNEPEFAESQKLRFNISQAIKQTLGENEGLADKNGKDPIAMELDIIETPFTLLQSDDKDVQAKTIVIRPKVMVDLRKY